MKDEDRKKTILKAMEVVSGFYEKYGLTKREQNAVMVLGIAGEYLLSSIDIIKEEDAKKIFN